MQSSDLFGREHHCIAPAKGKVLISDPFLCDSNFSRSVILLLDHGEEGSFGLMLNKRSPLLVNELVDEFCYLEDIPLYKGGPVGLDTLFYLHVFPDIEGSLPVGQGLYLNGDFNAIKRYILQGNPIEGKIRFFLGYSGWSARQLQQELEEDTWVVGSLNASQLMNSKYVDALWGMSVQRLGGEYAQWTHYPQNPSLN